MIVNPFTPCHSMQPSPQTGILRHLHPNKTTLDKQRLPGLSTKHPLQCSRIHQGSAHTTEQLTYTHKRIQVHQAPKRRGCSHKFDCWSSAPPPTRARGY